MESPKFLPEANHEDSAPNEWKRKEVSQGSKGEAPIPKRDQTAKTGKALSQMAMAEAVVQPRHSQ